jgi:hypothetical protein
LPPYCCPHPPSLAAAATAWLAARPPSPLLGDFIWPGHILQGDAGIIVADKTGRRVARIYRFNQDTGVVNDIPTEATLGIPNWGEIEVEHPAK